MTAPQVDLDAIERLGEYVSDCAWSSEGLDAVRGLDGAEYPEIATATRVDDAAWIAHFDPPTVRVVVDELRAGRKLAGVAGEVLDGRGVVTELRAALADYRKAVTP